LALGKCYKKWREASIKNVFPLFKNLGSPSGPRFMWFSRPYSGGPTSWALASKRGISMTPWSQKDQPDFLVDALGKGVLGKEKPKETLWQA
jgi:hypothetical protein